MTLRLLVCQFCASWPCPIFVGGRVHVADAVDRALISNGAFYEGYYIPQGFSIMQALYYLSAIAEATPDLPETPIGGRPGQVHIPYAENSTTPALTIQ